MMGGALAGPAPAAPQYAQFEVGKSGLAVSPMNNAMSEDALPPMPSWETAVKKHVLSEEERNAVELGELDPTTGQKIPLMAGGAGSGISAPPSPANELPASPYGSQPGHTVGGNGFMEVADQYSQNQGAYDPNGHGYRGATGSGMSNAYGSNNPQEMDAGGQGYGPHSPQDAYGSNNGFVGAAAAGGGYGRPPPQRQYSNDSHRPYPPQSNRQYNNDQSRPLNQSQYSDRSYRSDNFQNGPPRGPSRGPDPRNRAPPPSNNSSGFDFGTDHQYSRPAPHPQPSYDSSYAGSTAPPTYASRSPPLQEGGYRPYQPLSSQGRGGREPQNWDPVQRDT
jgi:hypothetical protein